MDPGQITLLIDALLSHQWVVVAAVVIHLIVRLLKSPRIPWVSKIPPRVRTLIAVLLGFAGAGLQALAAGVDWRRALAENLIAALLAIVGHDVLIEWLRGGRELGQPKKGGSVT
jgi:hypothetical protein